jgi:hypothetical protein
MCRTTHSALSQNSVWYPASRCVCGGVIELLRTDGINAQVTELPSSQALPLRSNPQRTRLHMQYIARR